MTGYGNPCARLRANYEKIAYCLHRISGARLTKRHEVAETWQDHLDKILDTLPSGSGLDAGPELLDSTERKLMFSSDFHHMDQHGYYSGWSRHTVVITPCFLSGFQIKITGRDRNGIKDHLYEIWSAWLWETRTPEQQRIENAAGYLKQARASDYAWRRRDNEIFAENNLRGFPERDELMRDWIRVSDATDPMDLSFWREVHGNYGAWPNPIVKDCLAT